MAAMLRDSVVVGRTRPRAIPLAMITMRKSTHGFPSLSHDKYGAQLGGPSGHRSSAMKTTCSGIIWQVFYATIKASTDKDY